MLEYILRRPQRLFTLVAAFFLIVFISTFFSVSSDNAKHFHKQLKKIPKFLRNQTCPPGVMESKYRNEFQFLSNIDSVEELSKLAVPDVHGNYFPPEFNPAEINKAPRAKAAFISLVRNSELEELRQSMEEFEYRFNRKYNYPWIFLNDVPFTDEFKKGVRKMTRAPIHFGLVPKEHWSYPSWIDQDKAAETRKKMEEADIVYGESESYRHMCRFQSGFFFEHPLTYELGLEYYWRVEPGVHLMCDVDFDPFVFMQLNNKAYGFTISTHEYSETIPTLWSETLKFVQKHPEYIAPDNAMKFVTDSDSLHGSDYNLCHFWSNFEIGDLRFFRGRQYKQYFDHLDKAGGFFYERWGDAPVHSIAASLLLNRSQIYHFDEIGYEHSPWAHCPANRKKYHDNGKCSCNPDDSFDFDDWSCNKLWWSLSVEGAPE